MAGLSKQLVTLAQGWKADTAAERRTAAQLLALATALDPGNAKAREVLSDFEKGSHTPTAEAEPLENSRKRIWQSLEWLEMPQAGVQGQALAACLADVMAANDPQHPRAQALRSGGERGAWKSWIPRLTAYETRTPVETQPAPDKIEVAQTGILLAEARVMAPLWKRVAKTTPVNWTLSAAPLAMAAKQVPAEDRAPKPFALVLGSQPNDESLAPLVPPLLKLLETHHGSLPAGGRVVISSPALEESLVSKKRQSISAAAAVLASSAISGREPEATIIGLIDDAGAFKLPAGFWNQLQSLGPGNGGRLVLPAAAAAHLPSLLALERPQLFFDYEIVLASNFKELLDLTTKTPVGTFAKVSAQFQEIRQKIGTQPLGPYIANSFVRRRLVEISSEAPYHYSAKLLAIQGSGNRPIFVTRAVLSAELRRAIAPLDWLVKLSDDSYDDSDIERLSATYETCRDQVERLQRYVEKNDRAWFEQVEDMVTTIRQIDRAAKNRSNSYSVWTAVTQAQAAFLRAYAGVAEELASASGEEAVTPEP